MTNAAALADPDVPSEQETTGNDADSFDFILEDVSGPADDAEESAASETVSPQEEKESDSEKKTKAQKTGKAEAEAGSKMESPKASKVEPEEDPEAETELDLPMAPQEESKIDSKMESEMELQVESVMEPELKPEVETEEETRVESPKTSTMKSNSGRISSSEPAAKPERKKEESSQGQSIVNRPSTETLLPEATLANLREDAIVRAIRSARPAVVNIRGEKVLKSVPYDASNGESAAQQDSQHVNGMGTGILFDPRGYIVTNFHVVDGIQEIHVTTSETKTYVAQVLARDKETDLAIIKIDALAGEVFQTLALGESGDLMSGETVIAVGNAFGYEHTVTKGIISALHRSVQVSDVQSYEDLIQTDASINPGNSGGPLLNIKGEMIGINVAVRAGAQGIGFAIPVNRAMEVVTKMVESCSAENNWHGIHFVSLPLGNSLGAVVQSVESNSPAESIGLKSGDVILAVNNQKVRHELDFACAILEQKPGETIRLTVSRNERSANVKLTMGAVSKKNRVVSEYTPEIKGRPAFNVQKLTDEEIVWKQLGILTSSVAGSTMTIAGNRKYNGGLLVQNVRANSPAARQGIQNGDILLGILRWETLSLENVIFVLEQPEIRRAEQVKFLLVRNGKVMLGHFSGSDFATESNLTTASAASPAYK
ncbi:MAG: trypsin-like peptidase domain-containing protein [Thermoguttaceae bacterium]|nr:trypsin-like peptidase domain-containing protein [Thermoguttaceae bacterium]